MFSSAIGLLTSILEALNKLDFKRRDKRKIGNELAHLYISLNEIISNGKEILRVLHDSRKDKEIKIKNLIKSLNKQAVRIRNMQKSLKKSQLETVLKIHLPRLEDLHILFDYKNLRLAVLTDQLKHQKLHKSYYFGKFPILSPIVRDRFGEIFLESITLIPPNEISLKISTQELTKIEKLCEELRHFLNTMFKIEEIV